MTRRPLVLWTAAVALTAVPMVYGWLGRLFGSTSYYMSVAFIGDCAGREIADRLWSIPYFFGLRDWPILVVAPAFAVWVITGRRARWAGRAAGWAAVAFLTLIAVYEPLLMVLDATQPSCLNAWRPFGAKTIAWDLYLLVPAAVLVAALSERGRRRAGPRITGAVLAAAGLLVAVTADASSLPNGKIESDLAACAGVRPVVPARTESPLQAISRMPYGQRKMAYLCGQRGRLYGQPGRLYGGYRTDARDRLSDAELLEIGRAACRSRWPGYDRAGIAYLCPEVVAERKSEAQMAAEQKAYRTRINAACKAPARRGPRPYRQGTRAVFTSEGGGYYLIDGEGRPAGDPFDVAIRDGLVGASRDGAAVMTGIENGSFCLTVQAYKSAPPVTLSGWDRVVEVGIDSPAGRTRISTFEDIPELPVLSAAGPGPYRVRVHVRGRAASQASTSELPVEEHLIIVFPGRAKEMTIYRNAER